MIIGSMCNIWDTTLLALTAIERWAATRKVQPRSAAEYSTILAIALVLLALVVLLWWVSYKRNATRRVPPRPSFSDGAERKGLVARERQILLAIVARSGLRRSHDIFTAPDAFDQGAARLLGECARSRTPQESGRLRVEVAGLREKLAYRAPVQRERAKPASSRDIPVGAAVELLRRDNPEGPTIGAIVVRNDDLEIAVETQMPVGGEAGEDWRVRYRLDGRDWQFDTGSVSCEDRKLILNHGEQVHTVVRDRPERLVIHAPATVARFPFIQAAAMQPGDAAPTDWFELVRGVVTQVSDTSVQIRSPLQVPVGERALVVFALAPAGADHGTNDASRQGHIVGHVGRVKHRQATGEEMVMTIDLTSVADREIEKLMHLAKAAASGVGGPAGARVMQGA
jgi:hypothetical protein